jgi:hypothetical protein
VTEEAFEVGLSFGGVPERLAVPFAAIKRFLDPAVQFGLQFEEIKEGAGSTEGGEQLVTPSPAGKGRAAKRSRPPAEHKGAPPAPIAAVPVPANPPTETVAPEPDKPTSGEVVRLDRFRKK